MAKRKARLSLFLLGALVLILTTISVAVKLGAHRQVTELNQFVESPRKALKRGTVKPHDHVVNVSTSLSVSNIFSREKIHLPDIGSLKLNQEIRRFFERVVFRNKTAGDQLAPKVDREGSRKEILSQRRRNMERLLEQVKKLDTHAQISISDNGILVVNQSRVLDTRQLDVYDTNYGTVRDLNPIGSKQNQLPSQIQSRNSYILALDFWDQQISGLRNLLSLQCWAAHLGQNVKVIEPFVIGSKFGALPLDGSRQRTPLTFGGLYNKSIWNTETPKYSKAKLAGLADWNTFVSSAQQSVVLVTMYYSDLPSSDCSLSVLNKRTHEFILTFDMEVVHEVCINLKEVGLVTTAKFDALVFGNLNISDTDLTVIISQWRGILNKDGWRVCLLDSPCAQGLGFSHFALHLQPNKNVINDANTFIQLYYPSRLFVGVMIRIEKVITSSGKGVSTGVLDIVKKCYVKILHEWSNLVKVTKINSTFLSMDYDMYGSSVFSLHSFERLRANLSAEAEKVTHTVLGRNMTVEKWDNILDTVASVDNPAYIALIQTTVAMKSRCIILAGGGLFQEHALQLYKRAHTKKDERCYIQLNQYCVRTAYIVPKSL